MRRRFVWDLAKARSNEAKHHVPFTVATEAFSDSSSIEWIDDDVFQEERWKLLGMTSEGILIVVYVERSISSFEDSTDETVIRIISARRATRHEQQRYRSQTR
jgi:uncharacterized DUF497 family protein